MKTAVFFSFYSAKSTIGFMVRNCMNSNLYLEGLKLLITDFMGFFLNTQESNCLETLYLFIPSENLGQTSNL